MKKRNLHVIRMAVALLVFSTLLVVASIVYSPPVHAASHVSSDRSCVNGIAQATSVEIFYGSDQSSTFCAYGTNTYNNLDLTVVSDKDIVVANNYCAQLTVFGKSGTFLYTSEGNAGDASITSSDVITQLTVGNFDWLGNCSTN